MCQPKALVDGILRKAGVEPEEDLRGELETEERQERQEEEAAAAELDQEAEEDGEVRVCPPMCIYHSPSGCAERMRGVCERPPHGTWWIAATTPDIRWRHERAW